MEPWKEYRERLMNISENLINRWKQLYSVADRSSFEFRIPLTMEKRNSANFAES